MTASVLEFPKSLPRPKQEAMADRGQEFFCRRCDNEFFKLHDSGAVVCCKCDTVISNLRVTCTR